MRRGAIKNPNDTASAILFGEKGTSANLSAVAKETGVPVSTLSDYKKNPSKITLDRLARIVSARGLNDEQILQLVGIYKGSKKNAGNKTRKL